MTLNATGSPMWRSRRSRSVRGTHLLGSVYPQLSRNPANPGRLWFTLRERWPVALPKPIEQLGG